MFQVPLGLKTCKCDMSSSLLKDAVFKAVGTSLGESAKGNSVRSYDDIAERVRQRLVRVRRHGAKRSTC